MAILAILVRRGPTKRRLVLAVPAALALLLTAGRAQAQRAPSPQDGCVCSQSFAIIVLDVVTRTGAPVPDAQVRVRQLRTGREVSAQPGPGPGTYVIVDDSWRDRIRPTGEDFRVVATVGRRKAVTRVRVSVPGKCKCHVQKRTGTTRLVLR